MHRPASRSDRRHRRQLVVFLVGLCVFAVGITAFVLSRNAGEDGPDPVDSSQVASETDETTLPSTSTTVPPTTAAPATTTTAAPAGPPALGAGSTPYVFPLSPMSAGSYEHGGHAYPATDIFAECGTTIVSPVNGVVQDVSREDLYDPDIDDGATRGGLSVSVIGDDGVRYYGSHFSEIEPRIESGVRVAAGDRLGAVGTTGSARGTPCHLHFGISPQTYPGDWEVRRGAIWPKEYLDSWRSGGSLSPVEELAGLG